MTLLLFLHKNKEELLPAQFWLEGDKGRERDGWRNGTVINSSTGTKQNNEIDNF